MAKVTYVAAEGETPVVTTRGIRFIDGQPQDLDDKKHADLIRKARGNPHFIVDPDGKK